MACKSSGAAVWLESAGTGADSNESNGGRIVDGRMAATWRARGVGGVSGGCKAEGSRGRTGMFGWLLPKGDASCGEAGQKKGRAGAKTGRSQEEGAAGEADGEVFERNSPMTMPSRPLLVCGSNTRPERR
jgi:hypothetical protein